VGFGAGDADISQSAVIHLGQVMALPAGLVPGPDQVQQKENRAAIASAVKPGKW